MHDAKKNHSPIPGLIHVGDADDFVLRKLDLLIQFMTKFEAAQRINLDQVNKELKTITVSRYQPI